MPRPTLVAAALFATACGGTRDRTSDSASRVETAGVIPAAPDTLSVTTEPPREIYIDSVAIGNPLVVTGRARTFENTVQVRLLDAHDAILTEVYETSVGEMGHHNPFTASVWLVRDPGPFVTVQSFEYSAKDGSIRSLTSQRAEIPGPRVRVTLSFATTDCTRTAEFTREVPRAVAVARLMTEMLVAGPTDAEKSRGATHAFPPGSRVNSVVLRDGELTVDFTERLQNVGGSCAAQAIRASVERTLARLAGVRRVVITAAGSRELALQP